MAPKEIVESYHSVINLIFAKPPETVEQQLKPVRSHYWCAQREKHMPYWEIPTDWEEPDESSSEEDEKRVVTIAPPEDEPWPTQKQRLQAQRVKEKATHALDHPME